MHAHFREVQSSIKFILWCLGRTAAELDRDGIRLIRYADVSPSLKITISVLYEREHITFLGKL